MPRKKTKRRKQRGGVRFRNILTAENAHRFNKILADTSEVKIG